MFRRIKVRKHEQGFLFKDGVFHTVLDPGVHWFADPLRRLTVNRHSVRDPWIVHEQLDVIVASGELTGKATVLDLNDHQRALVWIDNRFARVLGPGLHAMWIGPKRGKIEMIQLEGIIFRHKQLANIMRGGQADEWLEFVRIDAGLVGLLMVDGRLQEVLPSGLHAFWRHLAKTQVRLVDVRENLLDITGQEIMTADKVTLRLNAVVAFQVVDPGRAATEVEDFHQALHRDAQLALRAVVGTRELDNLLADKDSVTAELASMLDQKVGRFGVKLVHLGIRDVILPGEMKDLMNRVTEAKKAAEAALITRREEVAAMRAQANTARMLADSPTLMRLRELEVLEKVADKAKLTVVLGEGGRLTDKVVKVL